MFVLAPVTDNNYVGMYPAETPPAPVENGRLLLANAEAGTRGVLWKIGVLKSFAKFTGKHLC